MFHLFTRRASPPGTPQSVASTSAPTFCGPHLDWQQIPRPETKTPQQRWPQGQKGLRAVPLTQILIDNGADIRDVVLATPGTQLEKNLVLTIISNVAAFVHLLPASRDYHHVGPGGLLSHLLNTALYAAGFARSKFFGLAETPQQAARNANRWVIACIVAGLLHDVGKCRTSLTVIENTVERTNCLDPDLEGLDSWLRLTAVREYLVEWHDSCPQDYHERASLNFLHCLCPREFFSYLTDTSGAAVTRSLVLALGGAQKSSLVADVMVRADMRSTQWDRQQLASVPYAQREVGTTRLAEEARTSIRERVAAGTWTMNRPNSPLFVTDHGIFAWKTHFLQNLLQDLRALHVPGVPGDPEILAQALADRGVLVFQSPQTIASGGASALPADGPDMARTTWSVATPLTGAKHQVCVRLAASPSCFPAGQEPPPLPALLLGEHPSAATIAAWEKIAGKFPDELRIEDGDNESYEVALRELLTNADEKRENERAYEQALARGLLGEKAPAPEGSELPPPAVSRSQEKREEARVPLAAPAQDALPLPSSPSDPAPAAALPDPPESFRPDAGAAPAPAMRAQMRLLLARAAEQLRAGAGPLVAAVTDWPQKDVPIVDENAFKDTMRRQGIPVSLLRTAVTPSCGLTFRRIGKARRLVFSARGKKTASAPPAGSDRSQVG